MKLVFGVLVLAAVAIPQTLFAQAPRTEVSATLASSSSPITPRFPIPSAREAPGSRLDFLETARFLDFSGFKTDRGPHPLLVSDAENTASAAVSSGERSLSNETGAKTAFRPTQESQKVPIRLWRTLIVVQHGAAVFDAWSTRDAIQNGGAHELNPLFQPFAGSNAIYAATQVGPGLLDYLGYRMMKSKKGWMRRFWWVPQLAGTVGALFSGAHNLVIAQGRPSALAP